MAYLKNSAVNFLNLHYGLHALVMNGAGVFWVVYLLKAGVPIPGCSRRWRCFLPGVSSSVR